MKLAVALIGLTIAALGVLGVSSPARVLALVSSRIRTRSDLLLLAGLRLGLGAILLLAAPGARWPDYLQIMGALSLFSGAITPFFGIERAAALLRWWGERPPLLLRTWSALVLLFGLSFAWAVFPGLDSG